MAQQLTQAQEAAIRSLIRRGQVTAAQVVEAARPEDSPLHRFIGWHRTDAELADAYRLERARLALMLYRLHAQEETQRELSRVRNAEERDRLKETLKALEQNSARGLISYQDERYTETPVYRSVAREYAEGNESRILFELVRELEQWVGSRATLHPGFLAHMRGVMESVRTTFLPEEGGSDAA